MTPLYTSLCLRVTRSAFLACLSVVSLSGTVATQAVAVQKVSSLDGGFTGTLGDGAKFGYSLAVIGDLDFDGVVDLAVGAPGDNRVFILFLNADGTVDHQADFDIDDVGSYVNGWGEFGASLAPAGDVNGDGEPDLMVGAPDATRQDTWGCSFWPEARGILYTIRLRQSGAIFWYTDQDSGYQCYQQLFPSDRWNHALASIGDLDGDGDSEIARTNPFDGIGAYPGYPYGRVHLQGVPSEPGNPSQYQFGDSVTGIGDVDGDGVPDAVIGSWCTTWSGACDSTDKTLDVAFLNPDGSAKGFQLIDDTHGNLPPGIPVGRALADASDLDGNGVHDLIHRTTALDGEGLIGILLLEPTGMVRDSYEIRFPGNMAAWEFNDNAVANLGDLNGDGVDDYAVGAPYDGDGGPSHGAVWVVFPTAPYPSSTVVRNGSGVNPATFQETAPAIVGRSWESTIDIATPGALASLVVVSLAGPVSGVFGSGTLSGEILILPPLYPPDVQFGVHSLPIPPLPGIVGGTVYTQGLTFAPFDFRLLNALDVTIGTYQ